MKELNLKSAPLITEGAIAAVNEVGGGSVQGEAARLGLKPTRLPNGRKLWTFEQAEAITRSIQRRNGLRA